MLSFLSRNLTIVLLCAATVVLSTTLSAGAAKMITGKQIKNNSISTKDVKNGTLRAEDMNATTLSMLTGVAGPKGDPGDVGTGRQ